MTARINIPVGIRRRIGFIQGRLSPMVDGKIQAFPWDTWRDEFPIAARCGFTLMEWTLDHARLHENPLMTDCGRKAIRHLMAEHAVCIPAVTGDCFMQAPFHKAAGQLRTRRIEDLRAVVTAAGELGAGILVLPLVDNGSLENATQFSNLIAGLSDTAPLLRVAGVRIAMETDLSPIDTAALIHALPPDAFGITYDMGNSAALGYDPAEEWATFGNRILHIHVKDRLLGGGTVPLGTGDADLPGMMSQLVNAGYAGHLILQTARAEDGRHDVSLAAFRDMVVDWWRQTGGVD